MLPKMLKKLQTCSRRAFCHILNSIKYVLSLAVNDVKKYLSLSFEICMAFGITLAVFSLVIAVISFVGMVTCNSEKNS